MESLNSATGAHPVTVAGANPADTTALAPAAAVPPPGSGKVAVGFIGRDTDAQLAVDVDRIVAAMTGHPAYPSPQPTLAQVAQACTAFGVAVGAARDSRLARSQRIQARETLERLLRQLASYVQTAGNGDVPTLMGSGFPLRRSSQAPIGKLSAPANLRVVRGKVSGELVARCKPQERARTYLWRCAPTATPTAWLPVVITQSAHVVFAGLTPCTSYAVQVCVTGTAGPSDWSDAMTLVVL